MRIVGQFKGCDIRITDLHMLGTYGGFLLGPSGKFIEESNRRLVNEDVPKRIEKIWGKDRVSCIVDLDTIDYKKLLPSVEVIVWLCCSKPIQDGDGSNLFMAWFQEAEEDPFAKAVSNLKRIVWEAKAKDFWF